MNIDDIAQGVERALIQYGTHSSLDVRIRDSQPGNNKPLENIQISLDRIVSLLEDIKTKPRRLG